MSNTFPSTFLSISLWAPVVSALQGEKFTLWFPTHEYHWLEVAQQNCSLQISDYHENNRERTASPCAAALDCLLENSSESIKSNLAGSQVLLGLTPSILAYVGSDMAELAVLATQRPYLALLMSIGAPTQQVRQILSSVDVAEIINKPSSGVARMYFGWLWNLPTVYQRLAAAATYALAIGAMINSVQGAIYLDARTVVGFRCNAVYLVSVWVLLGITPTIFAIAAIRQRHCLPSLASFAQFVEYSDARAPQEDKEDGLTLVPSLTGSTDESRGKWISDLLFLLASLAALVQFVYGTAILSALTPISFMDALPVVMRFAVSNVVCRALLLLELEGIRIRVHGSLRLMDDEAKF
ncbi:unnamed protein product [Clonostachys rosea f. rosea IK726]|uniref:Uncharacterized protein n=1 Tax=Clonostachys rosea f. rosea IK726 TaxID=1349383 RepID=A0ACA9U1R7_BIOOC|nr:unnamed protein product [Clonostachys rosea f. rosea IK726]